MISFQSIPVEAHRGVAQYLTSADCKSISHTNTNLLTIYRPIVYEACVTLTEPETDCLSKKPYVPFSIICHPNKASWFPSESLVKLIVNVDKYKGDKVVRNLLHKFLFTFEINPLDYPLLLYISFIELPSLSQTFLQSTFLKTVHNLKLFNPELLVNTPYRIDSADSVAVLTEPQSPINVTNITRVAFTKISRLVPASGLTFASLESVKVIEELDTIDTENKLVSLLKSIALSPKLESVRLTIGIPSHSRCHRFLTQGIIHLPPDLPNCNLKLYGSETRWWDTTQPAIDQNAIIEIPQITSLSLFSFIPLIQQYHFTRAVAVFLQFFIENIDFSSFNYTVTNITALTIEFSCHPVDCLSGHVSALQNFLNLQSLKINFRVELANMDSGRRIRRLVATAKKISYELLNKTPLSHEDLNKIIKKKSGLSLSKTTFQIFSQLYLDPIKFLPEATERFLDEDDDATDFVVLCFQEALFTAIGKLKKLQRLYYYVEDFSYTPYLICSKSPYSPRRQFPNLALQKLLSINNTFQTLKQVRLRYTSSLDDFDVNVDEFFDSVNSKNKTVSGTLLQNNELVISDCYTITPKPCKIYTFNPKELESLDVLFDFETYGSFDEDKKCILYTNAEEAIESFDNEMLSPFN